MSNYSKASHIISGLMLAALLALTACGSRSNLGQDIPLPPDVETPCDLTDERVGQRVEVGGEVAFVDDVDPEWLYADLEADGCRVGITIEKRTYRGWSETQQATFTRGAQIVVQGLLASYPMPARPDEFQLIVELDAAPQALSEIPDLAGTEESSLVPLIGTECDLSHVEYWTDMRVQGEIILVDDSAAAGLYAELDRGDCSVRLWVERTRWDTLTTEEQSQLSAGKIVDVEGILTEVLYEPFLDLSFPPVLAGDQD
jgi:hypothetical protein